MPLTTYAVVPRASARSGGGNARVYIAIGAATAVACVAYALHQRRPPQRVMRLIANSKTLYRKRKYDACLDAARDAALLASSELPKSAEHMGALLHLAGVYSATRCFDDALRELGSLIALTEEAHGAHSPLLIPALHAKAEVLEAAGRPLAEAAEQLARARDTRRKACGENSIDSAFASFNLSSCLIRGSEEEGVAAKMRSQLLSQASSLALEACSVASALGQSEQAAEFAARLLEMLEESEDVEGSRMAGRLRDVYLEAAGEEWDGADSDGGDEAAK